MDIVLIDNYDSFTYNLVHYFQEYEDIDLHVIKNDQIDENLLQKADKIVISPGPGLPSQNGMIISVIRKYHTSKPIFGICLGLQAIYESFGGSLLNPNHVFHGVSSIVEITAEDPVLKGLPNPFKAGRYHSWVCDLATLPSVLVITAWDDKKQIMACRHSAYPTFGVQFHPESFLTPQGQQIIENFVRL